MSKKEEGSHLTFWGKGPFLLPNVIQITEGMPLYEFKGVALQAITLEQKRIWLPISVQATQSLLKAQAEDSVLDADPIPTNMVDISRLAEPIEMPPFLDFVRYVNCTDEWYILEFLSENDYHVFLSLSAGAYKTLLVFAKNLPAILANRK